MKVEKVEKVEKPIAQPKPVVESREDIDPPAQPPRKSPTPVRGDDDDGFGALEAMMDAGSAAKPPPVKVR